MITIDELLQGKQAFSDNREWLDRDIWHIPSVRAIEWWGDRNSEACMKALLAVLSATDYRDDSGLPETPYTHGYRDACAYIRRLTFGDPA